MESYAYTWERERDALETDRNKQEMSLKLQDFINVMPKVLKLGDMTLNQNVTKSSLCSRSKRTITACQSQSKNLKIDTSTPKT